MKRWVFWFILITAAALFISVCVAWSCALWSPRRPDRSTFMRVDAAHPLVEPLVGQGQFDTYGYVGPFTGVGWRKETVLAYDSRNGIDAPSNRNSIHYFWCGWPFKCFVGQERSVGGQDSNIGVAQLPDVPFVDRNGLGRIPTRPVWIGLMANVALFGLPGYVVLGFLLARRTVRHRRGCCLRCGYSLRGLQANAVTCPECGTAARLNQGSPPGQAVEPQRAFERA